MKSYLHALLENWKMRLDKNVIRNGQLIADNNFSQIHDSRLVLKVLSTKKMIKWPSYEFWKSATIWKLVFLIRNVLAVMSNISQDGLRLCGRSDAQLCGTFLPGIEYFKIGSFEL